MAEEKIKFEKALENLEGIVANLEGGELELEKSLKMFEEGIKMTKICQTHLSAAEKKIEKLVTDKKGEPATEPLEEEDSASEQDELPF
jgi:exodeoxyribonuclease VII small subunit